MIRSHDVLSTILLVVLLVGGRATKNSILTGVVEFCCEDYIYLILLRIELANSRKSFELLTRVCALFGRQSFLLSFECSTR